MKTIEELGGDATVTNVRFEGGIVRFRYRTFMDAEFDISVPTNLLYSNCQAEEGSFHIRVNRIAEHLPGEPQSGRYVAPIDFGQQMQMAYEGYQLALGLKASEYPFLLQVRGFNMLIVCPLRSVEQARVEPVKEDPV